MIVNYLHNSQCLFETSLDRNDGKQVSSLRRQDQSPTTFKLEKMSRTGFRLNYVSDSLLDSTSQKKKFERKSSGIFRITKSKNNFRYCPR